MEQLYVCHCCLLCCKGTAASKSSLTPSSIALDTPKQANTLTTHRVSSPPPAQRHQGDSRPVLLLCSGRSSHTQAHAQAAARCGVMCEHEECWWWWWWLWWVRKHSVWRSLTLTLVMFLVSWLWTVCKVSELPTASQLLMLAPTDRPM